jgi:hypothetical protein
MYRVAILWIGLVGSSVLAGSEKWYQEQKLLEPTVLPDYGGVTPDIHQDLLYLGFISDKSGPRQQMGRIYRRHGTQWTLEQELSIEAPQPFDSVLGKIQDDTCIVLGRYYQSVEGPNVITWSLVVRAYAFRYDGAGWNLIQELVPPEGGLEIALDVDSDVCVIGGNGYTHVFRYDGQRWNYEQKLPAGVNPSFNGIAISGNRIVSSAPVEKSTDGRIGAVYFFVHDGTQWQPDGKFSGLAPFPDIVDFRSISAAIDGEWCILGTPMPEVNDPLPGRVLIYRRTDRWRVHQELIPLRYDDEGFGASVFVRDGVCGTNAWDVDPELHCVPLYSFNGSIWAPHGKANLPMPDYDFVWNVAGYDDGHLLVVAGALILGPYGYEDGIGSAAVFRACPAADLTNDCRVDLEDFAKLAEEWMTGLNIE